MKQSTEQDYRQRIVRTLVHIQQHLDDELELEKVAAVAAFSQFHFHRVFRGLVGEPFKEHVRRLRLERAAQRLKQGDDPVIQIALEAGFEAHESFTRAFGAMFGVSPSSYRAAHKPAPGSASGTHFDEIASYHLPDYGDLPPVQVRELPPRRIVFLRHVGPYEQVGATWSRLMGWAGARGLLGPSMKTIGIVHDDPDVTPTDKIRYDAGVVVSRPIQPEGEFGVLELAGGRCAVVTYKGHYQGLGQVYQRIYGGWLPKSGYELRDAPAFEEYLNSPRNTRPEDLVTVIHVPLE
ncbi:MAG TPA: AraC family transcriptional regulator [Terriglobia bacterium]|nr:AraC family transcriptional regulator [Terriglobia bacterium]